jgi:SAM-dependent methyltransferase
MYDWEDRYRVTLDRFVPWIEQTKPLAGCEVLEFGCGTGSVGLALAQKARSVYGVDIDEAAVRVANDKQVHKDVTNARFEAVPGESILHAVEKFPDGIDVFMLYAVLEHMTTQERIDVLRVAREHLKPDGVLVVCESPNRLTWGDHHTSKMPFNLQLPPDMALRYYPRTPREFYVQAMDAAKQRGEAALEDALVRLGRGVSHHEFVLALANEHDSGVDSIVATNYDPLLLPARHVERDELHLARYCEAHADKFPMFLPPCFMRYYIDCIMTKKPGLLDRRFIMPWVWDTSCSDGVGYSKWDMLIFQANTSVLACRLPGSTTRAIFAVERRNGDQYLAFTCANGQRIERHLPPQPEPSTAYIDVQFDKPTDTVWMQGPQGCAVSFVGWEHVIPRTDGLKTLAH